MTDFARINDGRVTEIIAGTAVPIEARFHPDIIAALVPVPEDVPVEVGFLWDGESFAAPEAPEVPEPTVPESVPSWAAKGVLNAYGLLAGAQAAVTAAGGFWPFRWDAPTWARGDVLAIARQMQPPLTVEEVDALLLEAAEAAAA